MNKLSTMNTKTLFNVAINDRLHNVFLRLGFFVAPIIVFFSVFCKPTIAFSQVFCPATCVGAGEAGRASIDPMGSHFLNPAALPYLNSYNFGSAYSVTRPTGNNPVTNTVFMVTDNSSGKVVAGALAYVNKRYSFDDHMITDQDFSLALGTRILPKLSVGIFGHRLVRQNTAGSSWTKHNLSAGLLILPATFLSFGIVGYDMLEDADQDMLPVISAGAEASVLHVFKLRADLSRQEKRNPDKKYAFNSGIEFDLGEGFALSTGGIWDNLNNNTFWTAGLSWIGPRLSMAYAYKDNLNVAREFSHNFQAWINF